MSKLNMNEQYYKNLYESEMSKTNTLQNIMHSQRLKIDELTARMEILTEDLKEAKSKILFFTNSETAKNGFKEETLVCNDLNKETIKTHFASMLGVEYDECIKINGNHKCDIQSKNKILNAQVKKYKLNQFQQLDRHWIDDIVKNISGLEDITQMLKKLCEYELLSNQTHIDKSNPLIKLCETNYSSESLSQFLMVLNNCKKEIISFAFLGTNPEIKPEFLIGVEYNKEKRQKIVIFEISEIINYLETLNFRIAKSKTVLVLGDENIFSIQRKGGDKERKGSNQLQIKFILSKLIGKVRTLQYIH